jgi:hypothetical protein
MSPKGASKAPSTPKTTPSGGSGTPKTVGPGSKTPKKK